MASGVSTRVKQIDYDTGELIEIYDSISAAAEDNGLDRFVLINKLSKNSVAIYKNKKLAFCKSEDQEPRIIQLDYDTREQVGTYESVRAAANDNYISYISLRERLRKGNGVAIYKDKQLVFAKAIKDKVF